MVRLRFQQSLDDLKERLLVMAGMAEQAIQRAIEAYRTRDISICDLVDHGEQAIDRFEREIDQMALDLLAMEQPMAIDLRFILAVIKINADLERVGDAASSISDRVRDLQAFPVVDLPVDIPRMASLAAGMVRKALHAFIEADADLAESVLLLDDNVDRLNEGAYFALSSLMKTPAGFDSAGIKRDDDRPQPGARRRPRHQHRRRRDFLGAWRGCAPPCEPHQRTHYASGRLGLVHKPELTRPPNEPGQERIVESKPQLHLVAVQKAHDLRVALKLLRVLQLFGFEKLGDAGWAVRCRLVVDHPEAVLALA